MPHSRAQTAFLQWIDSIPEGEIRSYSEEAGYQDSGVSKWRRRKAIPNPTLSTLEGFARAFGVSVERLLTAGPKEPVPSDQPHVGGDFLRVPVLVEVSGGRPRFDSAPRDEKTKRVDQDHERATPLLFDRKWLQKQIGPLPARVHDAVFLAKVHGDSMAPTITSGETLMFSRWPDAEALEQYHKHRSLDAMIDSGAVYLVHDPDEDIDGGNTVKRVKYEKRKRRLVIYGDNAAETTPWTIDLREPDGADGGETRKLQRFLIGKWVPGFRM